VADETTEDDGRRILKIMAPYIDRYARDFYIHSCESSVVVMKNGHM
jgi:hypothetical protein